MSEATNEVLKYFEPTALEELDETTQLRIKVAKELFMELGRLMKSITLYGSHHQSSINFRARFFEVLTKGLMNRNQIVVEVQTYALVISDQVIYENPKVEGNFIYRFYTDGIRTLTLETGIEPEEVDALLDLFLLDWNDPSLFEDDAVTLMWERDFKHVFYTVATRYDENTEEAEEHKFKLNHILDRFDDLLDTCSQGVRFSPLELLMSEEQHDRLDHLTHINQRELLEKLIVLTNQTQRGRGLATGRGLDRFLQLLDQLAQLFAQREDISELERFLRQAFRIVEPEMRGKLIDLWAVPIFVQYILAPLYAIEHDHTLSALSCLQLLGAKSTPHISRSLGDIAEKHLEALGVLMTPHLSEYSVELCRSIRTGNYIQSKRIIRFCYESKELPLCLKIFKTAWAHQDQGVRYEALNTLIDELKEDEVVVQALFEGLNDQYSKIRTLSTFSLSQAKTKTVRKRLKEMLNEKDRGAYQLVDLRKLYAAAALSGIPSDYFIKKIEKRGAFGLLKGREEKHCALVGLAMSEDGMKHQEVFQKEGNRRLGGGIIQEAAQWGVRYLNSSPNQREQISYELFFRSVLTVER